MKECVTCNLCGADDYKVVFPTKFGQIVKCSKCNLMYSNPREYTDPTTIDCHYEDPRLLDQYLKKQFVQMRDYKKILPIINSLQPHKGRLLEIGSYVGTFLKFAKENGWEVTGIEPTKWCVDYAKEKMGLNLLKTLLKDALFPNETFDAVVMLHVIEHLKDAMAEISEINRILKPKGVLVVETPNYDTLWFKVLKDRERSVIKDHYYYFTPITLKKLIQKAGLTPIRTDLVGRTLTLDRLFYNISRISKSENIFKIYNKISPRLGLENYIIYLNLRDMMRVYSVK